MHIIHPPALAQVCTALDWLSQSPHQNPDLEHVLSLIATGRLSQNQGELLAIAHTASPPGALTTETICGALMAGPKNWNVSLAGCDRATTEKLFSLVQARGCPQRIAMPKSNSDWIRPDLISDYQLQSENVCQVMVCTEKPEGGRGRWAVPDDKPRLQAYQEANQAERGGRLVKHDWDTLIQQQRVAVLDCEGQVASIVKRGITANCGMIVGAFTFAPFRRRGFGKELLSFVLCELFQEFSAVKLWTDDDNVAAIALYESLGFRSTGSLYTGYFCDR
jgi:GNAT superfamily N-acetyltransferase